MENKHCIPCEKDTKPLKGKELTLRLLVLPGWNIIDEHHLIKTFTFADFKTALEFVNKIGKIAEEEGHHPDILLAWGKVEVTLFTHSAKGLTENDFIMAEMIQAAFSV